MDDAVGAKQQALFADETVLRYHPKAFERLGSKGSAVIILNSTLRRIESEASLSSENRVIAEKISDALVPYEKPGLIYSGVTMEHGGRLILVNIQTKAEPYGLRKESETRRDDNLIQEILCWQKKNTNFKAVLVTKNFYRRMLARSCGIEAEDYQYDRIASLYNTVVELRLLSPKADAIIQRVNEMREPKIIPEDMVFEATQNEIRLFPNHCCILNHESGYQISAIYKKQQGVFAVTPRFFASEKIRRVAPRNMHQDFFYQMLLEPEIRVVAAIGGAGSGKTLLPMQAGYELFWQKKYCELLVVRPMNELGDVVGTLPGTKERKISPWKTPIFDALVEILGCDDDDEADLFSYDGVSIPKPVISVLDRGIVRIEPTSYLQGCTARRAFMFVDEAQNTTSEVMETLATRIGKGSKLVITGDIKQVRNPKASSLINGMVHLIEEFRGMDEFGHIALIKSERDEVVEKMLIRFHR